MDPKPEHEWVEFKPFAENLAARDHSHVQSSEMKEIRMSVDLRQLRNLTPADKLRIVEELWDDLSASEEPIVIQEWHKAEARSRAAELEAQPEIALTREEIWERVGRTDG